MIKELEEKKSEDALLLVQKRDDLWRYQNERDEARKLQSSGNSRRVRKVLGLQHPFSSRSSKVDHDEEMTLESPRKRLEVQEVMNETAWNEARGREEKAWRLEPEGEMEMLETGVAADGVEGVYVDLIMVKGTSQSDVPGEEDKEIKSPRRKLIRGESKEPQDDAREASDTDQEEAERLSFAPSATSVPQKPLFRGDNQCSEKTLNKGQLVSVVIQEGEESYTTNICQKCYNDSLKAKGEKTLTNWQWRQFAGQKAHRGRLWKMVGKDQHVRGMW